jgi:DNA-binding response OmpR family regulator
LPTTVGKRWRVWKKTRPDVVLLDIRMPVMDGRTTLAEIRKQASLVSLPVIAVTASSKAGEEMELQSQFSGYIRKPFSRQTLFVALAQFLQRAPPGNGLEGQNLGQTLKSFPIPTPDQAAQWQELALELRRQEAPNGRSCVRAWRSMRRGPLLTSFSPSARRRNVAR